MHPRGIGLDALSDDLLLARLGAELGKSRCVEAELVALIAEVDARRLYLREACSSMHAYATERLHLSDAEAYLRITVARLSRRLPLVLTMLADGRLHLSGIAKLAPHLRGDDGGAVLARAAHRSKREIDALVAELSPRPDAPALVRRLPDSAAPAGPVDRSRSGELRLDGVPSGGVPRGNLEKSPVPDAASVAGSETPNRAGAPAGPGMSSETAPLSGERAPGAAGSISPTSPGRYKVQFTAGADLRDKIARAQALLRHRVPVGDLAAIVDRAMTLLLRELERARIGATPSPRKQADEVDPTPSSRTIPAPIRRAVWARDEGRCTFRSRPGERCSATEHLEFHHVIPFARGGDHSPENVTLRCFGHNAYQAELDFGAAPMAAARRRRGTGAGASTRPAPPRLST